MRSNLKTPVEIIIQHLQKYSFPVTVGEKESWIEYEESFIKDKLFIEEANNEMLIQEIHEREQHIKKLFTALKGLYIYIDSPLEPGYEFAIKEARDLMQQHEEGSLPTY
jgi:uncharacterized protein with ParB-like and HNH nuclease domain